MKTHVLSTKDGLEIRLTQEDAMKAMKTLDQNQPVYINGNRITNFDGVRIRKIAQAPVSLALEAPKVFAETEKSKCLRAFLLEHWSALRKKGKVVYPSLISWCANELGTWNPVDIAAFMDSDWEKIQEHNVSNPQPRLDQSDTGVFIRDNQSGKHCGKCMNGFLPGKEGLVFCTCNGEAKAKHQARR